MRMQAMGEELHRLSRQVRGEYFTFAHLVGFSESFQATVSLAKKAASSDMPVLLTGESGVGKELFAKAIHGESRRKDKPFITVNCGAIPPNLAVATLFGHEKGAFTGAIRKEIGKFREAEGGTIFLDEVGELQPEAQVALLRALQEHEIQPVGQAKPITVDVRVVSATNRDLADMVREKSFRQDLFYRLNGFPVSIPPLRARNGDVSVLAKYFLRAREGHAVTRISPACLKALESYSWPGNIRELEHVISRGMVLADGDVLDVTNISTMLGAAPLDAITPTNMQDAIFRNTNGTPLTMAELEQTAIQYWLDQHRGNIAKVAATLEMGVSTIYKKLEKAAARQG